MMNVEERVAPRAVSCHPDAGMFREAEKELSAFLSAVALVRGQQCVTIAAKHWMQALEDACPSNFPSRECFRKITLAAVITFNN